MTDTTVLPESPAPVPVATGAIPSRRIVLLAAIGVGFLVLAALTYRNAKVAP